MVHPAEVRRREQRAVQARAMHAATAHLCRLPDDCAALHRGDQELADAIGALINTVADGARDAVNAEDWAHALRFSQYVLHPLPEAPPSAPLPSGYAPPPRESGL